VTEVEGAFLRYVTSRMWNADEMTEDFEFLHSRRQSVAMRIALVVVIGLLPRADIKRLSKYIEKWKPKHYAN
jgi:hypothetical protein